MFLYQRPQKETTIQTTMGSWNPKQPFINGCLVKQPSFMQWFGIIQLKHPFINGCLGFQDSILSNPTSNTSSATDRALCPGSGTRAADESNGGSHRFSKPTKWEIAKVNLLILGKLSFKWNLQNACDFSVLLFSFRSKVYISLSCFLPFSHVSATLF